MNESRMPAIGIPRAMLYYRYGALWEQFLQALGVSFQLSPPSSRGILEAGTRLAAETGATFVQCDVSKSADVQKVIAAAEGKLDIIYNNAGVYLSGKDGRITDIDEV